MVRKIKNHKLKRIATILIVAAIVLEALSFVLAFALGTPYDNTCPAPEMTILPGLCVFLSVAALLFALASFFISIFTRPKHWVFLISIIVVVLILYLGQTIIYESGYVINFCSVRGLAH